MARAGAAAASGAAGAGRRRHRPLTLVGERLGDELRADVVFERSQPGHEFGEAVGELPDAAAIEPVDASPVLAVVLDVGVPDLAAVLTEQRQDDGTPEAAVPISSPAAWLASASSARRDPVSSIFTAFFPFGSVAA